MKRLVCHGPDEVGSETQIVLGARGPDVSIDEVETSGEIYNVLTGRRHTR